jgi:short-subunit dehydrogenase
MVSSIAGRIPMTPCSVYSASKHGMVALAELLRVELARFDVGVQVVCPGRVETDFFSHESFRTRAPRREANQTVAIDVVSRAIIDAIERDRFMTNVPRHYGLLAWASAALPVLFKPVWHRLLTSRVESVYDELARTEAP